MTTAELSLPITADVSAPTFTLTAGQQDALNQFYQFLCSPNETVFVLSGYAGCGKSTLVKTLLDRLPRFMQTARLICPQMPRYNIELTATTNKAAENLERIVGCDVRTIHSLLGLRLVPVDIKKREFKLSPKSMDKQTNLLVFIDEASKTDNELLSYIFQLLDLATCKVVFIGDRAQLVDFKTGKAPVFDMKVPGAALTEVVRQAKGNPIVDLATQLRETVNTGVWPKITPDGFHIQYLDRDAFKSEVLKEFGRTDWRYNDSKVLGWTNAFVIDANRFVRQHVMGSPHIEVGDYAVCNSFVQIGKQSIKTDQLVLVTGISEGEVRCGVPGTVYTLDGALKVFMPVTLQAKAQRIREAKAADEISVLYQIEQSWIDLRPAYAQTIDKSQGSTYDKVFLDLSDVARCNNGDQVARMLYVGVSRARSHLYLTGDIA